MTEYMDVYCPECDVEVHSGLRVQPATLFVRGEQIGYSEVVAICPACGAIVGDARIESANLERAYDAYRVLHGILSSDEIRSLRESYGLSLREFSKFLGFGEQTVYRYEHGDIPDRSHNTTMMSAKSAEGARLLLSQNGHKLNGKSVARIEGRIQAMVDGSAGIKRVCPTLEQREAWAPCAANGFRRLDLDRVAALVLELANKCHELYWTKLQKAAFFADMVCYERCSRSLTGLSYAHATYGPVIDRKDEVRCVLVDRGVVDFREHGWGEILMPLQPDGQPFNANELALIDEIARFVNSFHSASELSDFSHALNCWGNSADGETIEYTRDNGEVGRAMLERMKG